MMNKCCMKAGIGWTIISSLLLSLIVFLSIFFFLLFNTNFYQNQFELLNVYDGDNNGEVDESLDSLFSFFLYKTNNIVYYDSDEISHMKDVRKIICFLEYILLFSGIGLILILLFRKEYAKKKQITKIMMYSGIINICGILLLVLLTINFDTAFLRFHEIFFPAGNWSFDPSVSFMKFMFPDEFFVNFFQRFLSWVGGISIAIGMTGFVLRNRH